jgi:hypothetical protein
MGFLKVLFWSLCCIGLGIALATMDVGGRTPLEHAKRAWKHKVNPSKLDQLKDSLGEAVEGAKDTLQGARDSLGKEARPRERHSQEDREALNKLIARRNGK